MFTAASCGDRKEKTTYDDNGSYTSVTYTCTGTFDGRSGSHIDTSVTSSYDYRPGTRTPAYATGGDVYLADHLDAAIRMATWFTAACAVACLEVPVVRRLSRRIRGMAPDRPGETGHWWSDMPIILFAGLIFAPVVMLFWLLAMAFFAIFFAFLP